MPVIGTVSFLNARPLVDDLERGDGIVLAADVPSRLLAALEAGRTAVAMCPVIDYQASEAELVVVPAGAIGSDGETLTVRLFSRRPIPEVESVAVDEDSHTSVALLEVVLDGLFGRRPRLEPLGRAVARARPPEAQLLIGDKVVSAEPPRSLYPHQLDLGRAWKELTGLPFVFATWMARADAELADIPDLLAGTRRRNSTRIADIVRRHHAAAGWPEALAHRYLGELLRYEIGPRELEAMQLFWARCHALGLIPRLRPLRLHVEGR